MLCQRIYPLSKYNLLTAAFINVHCLVPQYTFLHLQVPPSTVTLTYRSRQQLLPGLCRTLMRFRAQFLKKIHIQLDRNLLKKQYSDSARTENTEATHNAFQGYSEMEEYPEILNPLIGSPILSHVFARLRDGSEKSVFLFI